MPRSGSSEAVWTKHTYQWKSSNSKVEHPKLKLRRRQYGTHWVAFDKKPKH